MHIQKQCLLSFVSALLLLAGAGFAAAKEFTIVGTGDGLDILRAVSDAYLKQNPEKNLKVPPSIGSGGAIAAVGADRETLGRIARPLTTTELASGIQYHPIFAVPSAFFVHPGVPVRNLTGAQLKAIFTGEITSWKDVGGPDMRIRVVRREDADSSVLIFRSTLPDFAEIKFSERSKLALTTQEAINSIQENPGAIGFASFSVALSRTLGVVSINGVSPVEKNYPAKVILALIYKPGRIDADIRQYLDFLASNVARRTILEFGAEPSAR